MTTFGEERSIYVFRAAGDGNRDRRRWGVEVLTGRLDFLAMTLLPLREKVARQGRMRGLATLDEGREFNVPQPLIRPATPSTFSRKGRRKMR